MLINACVCAEAVAMPVQLCFWILQSAHYPWKAQASSFSGNAAACPPFAMPVLLLQCADFCGPPLDTCLCHANLALLAAALDSRRPWWHCSDAF